MFKTPHPCIREEQYAVVIVTDTDFGCKVTLVYISFMKLSNGEFCWHQFKEIKKNTVRYVNIKQCGTQKIRNKDQGNFIFYREFLFFS